MGVPSSGDESPHVSYDPWQRALAILAILVGTILQRLSGAGVGLVVSPVLVLLFGPAMGVFSANTVTMISASLIMISVWPRIDWPRAWRVLAFGAPGALLGAYLVLWLPSAWLSIIVGGIVLSAVLITRFAPTLPHWDNLPTLAVSSFVAGSFNTTAGVAAPAVIVSSRLSRRHRVLAPLPLGAVEDVGDDAADAARDAQKLYDLLGQLGIGAVLCGPNGGRHVWIGLSFAMPRAQAESLRRLVRAICPTLDLAPLSNPVAGCVRPPPAPPPPRRWLLSRVRG